MVRVVWKDIIRPTETWMFAEDLKTLQPAVIETVGWLVDTKDDQITIASSLGDDGQIGDVNCIPRSVITIIEPVASIGVETNE